MSDPSNNQMSDPAADSMSGRGTSVLTLHYAGVSAVERSKDSQQVCLFTNSLLTDHPLDASDAQPSPEGSSARVTIAEPLVFREAMRVFLTLHQPKGSYHPEDPKAYEAYAGWRRNLDPKISELEMTRAFYQFLREHDPDTWVGCDPTVSLNDAGLAFETLDHTGRIYAALNVKPQGIESSTLNKGASICAQFEGGEALQAGLTTLNQATPLIVSVGTNSEEVSQEYVGEVKKELPTPTEWQRNFTQILATATRPLREISLSRMDLYNILQQLRLNADIPKQKSGVRFELIPGKLPELILEPWSWRHVCSSDVYRGDRAEVLGVWDRRDLLIFDALLPYVEKVTLRTLGEAQPTFWALDCGTITFTLATMGFRPNNWSRGVLLDLTLPRVELSESTLEQAQTLLSDLGPTSAESFAESLKSAGLTDDQVSGTDIIRTLIQAGFIRPDFSNGLLNARRLFADLSPNSLRYRNQREAWGTQLAELNRTLITISELPTGEIEVVGSVSELPADHLPVEPVYSPRFQIKEGAGMRKVGCDCAWMKDREKQKIGPCSHVVSLWVRYATDEAVRQAELAAHPERVEVATAVYFKRRHGRELSRIVELKRRQLTERWEDQGEAPRHFHRVFSHIAAARAAYFKRVAELERREYMDASQS